MRRAAAGSLAACVAYDRRLRFVEAALRAPCYQLCLPTFLNAKLIAPACFRAPLLYQAADGYQLQDLRCMKCASVATNHLQQSCDVCGGHLRDTQPPVGDAYACMHACRAAHL